MKSEIINRLQKTPVIWWRTVFPEFIDKQNVKEEHISDIKIIKNFCDLPRDLVSATITIEGYKGKIIYKRKSSNKGMTSHFRPRP